MTKALSLDAGMRGEGRYLYELECVRGLAFLLVFLFHAWGVSLGAEAPAVNFWTGYIAGGNTGVTLFFVLSGFLLSLPWLRYAEGSGREIPGVLNYYLARILRIAPLYLFAVALAGLLTGQWSVAGKAALFQFVGFDMFPYSVVWWTLTTEVQFYLLLPLGWLAWLHPGWPRKLLVLSLLVWLAGYVVVFVYPGSDGPIRSYWLTKSLFGRLPAFLVGIAAAWVYLRLRSGQPRSVARQGLVVTAGLIAAWVLLGLVLGAATAMGEKRAEWVWHIHHTYEAVIWAVLVLLLLLGNPWGKVVLVNRPLAVLGKLSYSLYLNHVPILFFLIYAMKQRLGAEAYVESPSLFLLPLLALLVSLLLALISYRLIELPFLKLKHRVPL